MTVRRMTSYRYPTEHWILGFTLSAVFLVILLTAALTFRISLIIVAVGVAFTYISNRVKNAQLIIKATLVNDRSAAALTALARQCIRKLGCGTIQLFIVRSPDLNAYTFGLFNPKIVVLYSNLFLEMDRDEICFILGHEIGHICLGHTWLNSIVGGIAGLPSTFLGTTLLKWIFLWWNRACEYSADRAGLLACGNLDKALSALVKLAASPGGIRSSADLQRVLDQVEAEAGDPINKLSEIIETHPMIARRMNALRNYAKSSQYRLLKDRIDQNGSDLRRKSKNG
jgi:Zn-dependent protease with chaperone function